MTSDKALKHPYFSIIIPVYNSIKFIDDTIRSVLCQEYDSFEIIIVDDFSTDGCYEHCMKNYSRNPHVRVYRQEKNLGVSAARNLGIKAVSGQYIMFLDSDDLLIPNILEKLQAKLDEFSPDVYYTCGFYTGTEFVDGCFKKGGYGIKITKDEALSLDLQKRVDLFLNTKIIFSSCTKIYKKEFIYRNSISFDDGVSYGEDMLFTLYCLLLSDKFYLTPDLYYFYRTNLESAVHGNIGDFDRVRSITQDIISYSTKIDEFFLQHPSLEVPTEYLNRIKNFFITHNLEFYYSRHHIFHTANYENDTKLNPIYDLQFMEKLFENKFGSSYYFVKFLFEKYINAHENYIEYSSENKFLFPFHLFHPNEKIIIYGAGSVGTQFYCQAKMIGYVDLVGIVDREIKRRDDVPVQSVDDLKRMEYDSILVAVKSEFLASEIKKSLLGFGIPEDIVKWDGDSYREEDFFHRKYLPLLNMIRLQM